MKRILLLSAIILSSCSSVVMSPGAERVRISTSTPSGCAYLGEVFGSYKGDSVSNGLFINDPEGIARVDLKNQAAKMGADTVEILQDGGTSFQGEAYNCSRVPASK